MQKKSVGLPSSIDRVAYQREPSMGHVRSDLVMRFQALLKMVLFLVE